MISVSSGLAVAILALVALPLAETGWSKAGVTLPESVQWMLANRYLLAAVGVGCAIISTVAVFGFRRSPLLRYAVHVVFGVIPIVIAIAGIFAWWLVYAAMLQQQMQ